MMFTRLREWLIRKLGGMAIRDLQDIRQEMEMERKVEVEELKERLRLLQNVVRVRKGDMLNDPIGYLSIRHMEQQYKPTSEGVA